MAFAVMVLGACAEPERTTPPDYDLPEPPETVRPDAPSVSGGTLLLASSGTLFAADPARDVIHAVRDFGTAAESIATRALEPGDEPGRLVEDSAGRVHVALRGGGAVVTLSGGGSILRRRSDVCPAPRGLAHDPVTDHILVACAGGELVSLEASNGAEARRVFVDTDLRDVVVTASGWFVSRFRSAELLTLDASGAVVARRAPVSVTHRVVTGEFVSALPHVAWRTLATPDGDVLMLHQRAFSSPLETTPMGVPSTQYYGRVISGCATSVVQTTVTRFPADGSDAPPGPVIDAMPLAVDMAIAPDGTRFAVTSAATSRDYTRTYPLEAAVTLDASECLGRVDESFTSGGASVVWHDEAVVVQMQAESRIRVHDPDRDFGSLHSIPLPQELGIDSPGYRLFHDVGTSNIACASCHPEGGEDGHSWDFEDAPPRRTQTLLGGIMATAPFHWNGEHEGLESLMVVTFTQRMQGGELDARDLAELGGWLDGLRALPAPPTDAERVGLGAEVFVMAGCESCHAGVLRTNNDTVDFGEGTEALQVPMLRGVAHRSPWLNDGCASSLEETIDGSCAPGHESVVPLTAEETSALVEYLRSL